jgi:hypothetical protein
MARAGSADLPDGESEKFLRDGLDRFLLICPVGQNTRCAAMGFASSTHPTGSSATLIGFAHLSPIGLESRLPNRGRFLFLDFAKETK